MGIQYFDSTWTAGSPAAREAQPAAATVADCTGRRFAAVAATLLAALALMAAPLLVSSLVIMGVLR